MTHADTIHVLVISGPVGVGKTTVAAAISELLAEHNCLHAVVDLIGCVGVTHAHPAIRSTQHLDYTISALYG